MKILFACVGNRDPFDEGKPGPVLTYMEYARNNPRAGYVPDRVYLFSTLDREGAITPTQRAGEATAKIVQETYGIDVCHLPLPVSNPTDFDEVVEAMRSAVSSIIGDVDDRNDEYLVFVNPGTPQMQTTWLSLINYGFLKAMPLQSVLAKQPPVSLEKWVIQPVKMEPVFEGDLIQLACSHTRQGVFFAARDALHDLSLKTRNSRRRRMARLFCGLLDAYDSWNTFHYGNAQQELGKFLHDLNDFVTSDLAGKPKLALDKLSRTVAEQMKAVANIANGKTRWSILDTYHRARMMSQLNNYRQALVYCWDVCESVFMWNAIQVIQTRCKLGDGFTLPKGRLDRFMAKDTPQTRSIKLRFREIDFTSFKYFDSALAQQMLLHKDVEGPLPDFLRAVDNREAIDRIRLLRNDIVHDRQIAYKKDGKDALKLAREIINAAFDNPEGLSDYPLSMHVITEIAGKMQRLV